jgi:hypothetical protein
MKIKHQFVKRNGPKQPENSFYALFWPFGTPKGLQVGMIYGLISKLKLST